jgi:hypothetical protein
MKMKQLVVRARYEGIMNFLFPISFHVTYLAAEAFDAADCEICNGCIGAGTASAISLFT